MRRPSCSCVFVDVTCVCVFKQLSSIPETSSNEDVQEFLALNSDATTYFGRKPVAKSRIDKVGRVYLFCQRVTKAFGFLSRD